MTQEYFAEDEINHMERNWALYFIFDWFENQYVSSNKAFQAKVCIWYFLKTILLFYEYVVLLHLV